MMIDVLDIRFQHAPNVTDLLVNMTRIG